jgi:transcriptional regulator with XRE-family HTH domain
MNERPADPAAGIFGENLARERDRQHLSTRTLARLAGMHGSEISRIETGKREPKVSTAIRLADALRVPLRALVDGPSDLAASPPEDVDKPSDDDLLIVDRALYRRLGEALRRERESQGLSQEELALVSGLGRRAVGEVEAGKATAEFRTWLAVIQSLGFKLVVVRRQTQSSP